MATWLVPPSDLTTDQLRAIELPTDDHNVVMGGPGSGKTTVLLHRARYLAQTGNVPPERFHVFVFTNVLSTYIRSAMDLLGIPETCVSTFDDWCRRYYEDHISTLTPWDEVANRPDFAAIREGVFEHCRKSVLKERLFDFVLIDEGQDLDYRCFGLLTRIAGHVTVGMDHTQQIYDQGSDEGEIFSTLGCQEVFLEPFRRCPYITQMASLFIPDERLREAYLQQTRTAQTDIETPLLYHAAGVDDEMQTLVEMVNLRVQKGDRVAVLLPLGRQMLWFAQRLREAGLDVETQDDLNFASDTPKVITYHSAKGLTFESVLLPRLTPESFQVFSPEQIERLLFVALTRATRWAYLSTDEMLPHLQRLEPMINKNRIAVRKASGVPSPQLGQKKQAYHTQHTYNRKPVARGFGAQNVSEVFVESSHIISTGYDCDNETLYIKFEGDRVYAYFHVPESIFSDFLAAESHGRFANRYIYWQYEYVRQPDEAERERFPETAIRTV